MAVIISTKFVNVNNVTSTTPVAKTTTLKPKATSATNLTPKARKTTGAV